MSKQVLDSVARYYTERIQQHGAVARGVDWNGPDSQVLRFRQLLKVFEPGGAGSLNDLGCGYGALLAELDRVQPGTPYAGFDISREMIERASGMHAARPATRFVMADRPDQIADYGVASGIFSVRLDASDDEWWSLICRTLDALHETSRLGFAFNCLTSYSDAPLMKPHLYYADPCKVFDHCKRRHGKQVALLHDYGLYEFTIIVRKDGAAS
jgi:SAM-dependent methyltransferase